jgi:hypothetical protein
VLDLIKENNEWLTRQGYCCMKIEVLKADLGLPCLLGTDQPGLTEDNSWCLEELERGCPSNRLLYFVLESQVLVPHTNIIELETAGWGVRT